MSKLGKRASSTAFTPGWTNEWPTRFAIPGRARRRPSYQGLDFFVFREKDGLTIPAQIENIT